MSNLESPGVNSSQGFGGIENGESSDASAQFSTPDVWFEILERLGEGPSSFDSTWEDTASEDDLAVTVDFASSLPPESARNDLKRKAAISNHKGVHFRLKNKKFVARLCLPGGKSQKLELGEYKTHDEAARAYHVGAFYYSKSSTSSCCGEDHSFLETLPCIPDNLSHACKMAWVRERARHSAASIGTSESPGICSSKRARESGGSSFDARPGTPVSYGTQGSCDDYHCTPTTPTMLEEMGGDRVDSLPLFRRIIALQRTSESKRQKCVQTRSRGSPNVELQQGRNSNALTNQAPVVDHQGVSQVKMTDCILFALVELRKQGWEWTLKLRSPSSVETGVLFSVPKGQHVAPTLRITDIILNSFHELREQGWEVHLQPHGGGDAELRSELRVAPTGSVAQDKMKASKFSALRLKIGTWLASGTFVHQLEVKFSYAKQKLVWQALEGGQSRKMEIHWSDIDAMKASSSNDISDTLQIYVSRPPSCFAMLGSCWEACTDFTEGQASKFKLHTLLFRWGTLKGHYEKLVHCDSRLEAAHIRGQECEWSGRMERFTRLGSCFSPGENTGS